MTGNRLSTEPATIAATSTAVPPYVLTRDDVKTYMQKVFEMDGRRMAAMTAVIDGAEVHKRHAIFPVEYIVTRRSFAQTSLEYREHAVRLGREAAEACLTRAGMKPSDIDLIITVSCTGFMIPSLDAYLINLMGFRRDVRRLPITELGCAAGAMALTRASEFVRARPGANVLVLSVELPTLTFQREDLSQANLISCVLFGDGAAAAIVTGRPVPGPRMLQADTYTFPDSLDAMGFDLRDTGFHVVLSKAIPEMIRGQIRPLVDSFLGSAGLTRKSIAGFILHPGGRKVLSYVEDELGLSRDDTQISWDVLRDYGNLSSATILFILHRWIEARRLKPGEYGLAATFGPGFSAEMILLQWC